MNKSKLGIIGIGNMGSSHSEKLINGEVPQIELVAVADRDEKRRSWLKDNLPNSISVFNEGEELINSGICDAMLIATPHYQHPTLAIKAFEKGIHVLCEKPAGVYTKQVRAMNDAAKKSGLVFAMMFNQRLNSVYMKMRELIQTGDLSEIKRVNWIITDWYRTQAYYNLGSWRATWAGEGGGVLINQAIHALDLLIYFLGNPVVVGKGEQ